MVFAQITGVIIVVFGIFIGLTHFGVISDTFFGYNLVMVGIILFILHEAHALVRNLASDTNKIVSIGVPSLFIIIAGSYFIKAFIPLLISQNLTLVITILMIVEGLYRLH